MVPGHLAHMPLQLDQLQQSLGETGLRRLAMFCNLLLLGWIAWLIAQPVLDWQQPATDTQSTGTVKQQPARIADSQNGEQHDIASWHLFGKPAAQLPLAVRVDRELDKTDSRIILLRWRLRLRKN